MAFFDEFLDYYENQLEQQKATYAQKAAELQSAYQQQQDALAAKYAAKMADLKQDYDQQVKNVQTQAAAKQAQIDAAFEKKSEELTTKQDASAASVASSLAKLKQDYEARVQKIQTEATTKQAQIDAAFEKKSVELTTKQDASAASVASSLAALKQDYAQCVQNIKKETDQQQKAALETLHHDAEEFLNTQLDTLQKEYDAKAGAEKKAYDAFMQTVATREEYTKMKTEYQQATEKQAREMAGIRKQNEDCKKQMSETKAEIDKELVTFEKTMKKADPRRAAFIPTVLSIVAILLVIALGVLVALGILPVKKAEEAVLEDATISTEVDAATEASEAVDQQTDSESAE